MIAYALASKHRCTVAQRPPMFHGAGAEAAATEGSDGTLDAALIYSWDTPVATLQGTLLRTFPDAARTFVWLDFLSLASDVPDDRAAVEAHITAAMRAARRHVLVVGGEHAALHDAKCLWQLQLAQRANCATLEQMAGVSMRSALPARVAHAVSERSMANSLEVRKRCHPLSHAVRRQSG
jgi:hypothetical protein